MRDSTGEHGERVTRVAGTAGDARLTGGALRVMRDSSTRDSGSRETRLASSASHA